MILRFSKPKEIKPIPKSKWNFNSKVYDALDNSSFEGKIGVTRVKEIGAVTFPEKIKSNASFSAERANIFYHSSSKPGSKSLAKKAEKDGKIKNSLKLPQIRKPIGTANP